MYFIIIFDLFPTFVKFIEASEFGREGMRCLFAVPISTAKQPLKYWIIEFGIGKLKSARRRLHGNLKKNKIIKNVFPSKYFGSKRKQTHWKVRTGEVDNFLGTERRKGRTKRRRFEDANQDQLLLPALFCTQITSNFLRRWWWGQWTDAVFWQGGTSHFRRRRRNGVVLGEGTRGRHHLQAQSSESRSVRRRFASPWFCFIWVSMYSGFGH